jgi:N-acetylneuraminic acid mutarotase
VKSVEQAMVSDGSIGTFAVLPGSALETARYLHTTAIAGNYLYVVGGNDGATILASVERASINADGSLGTFATITGGLVNARMSHASIVVRDQLYVLGGVNGPAADLNDVEHAAINADGSLGTFDTVSGVAFVTPRVGTTMAVIKDYLYAFGGFGPQAPLNTVERAPISADGSLGGFELLSD